MNVKWVPRWSSNAERPKNVSRGRSQSLEGGLPMTVRIHAVAVALATALVPTAYGQAPAPGSTLPQNLVAEPTASLSIANSPNADIGKQLVDAINADQSLKG